MDQEVQVVILAEKLEHDLHPTDGWDMSVELDMAHTLVDRIDAEHAIKVESLSEWVVRISIVLVDLALLPIQDIPQLSK
jgi:hypothetical protein